MKFSSASLVLLVALLAVCLFQIEASETDKSSTPLASYFGVDANDAEAVRAKQRELSEEKFKELFGEEAHEQLNFEFMDDKEKPDKEGGPVSGLLKKMVDLIKHGHEMLKDKLDQQKRDRK